MDKMLTKEQKQKIQKEKQKKKTIPKNNINPLKSYRIDSFFKLPGSR